MRCLNCSNEMENKVYRSHLLGDKAYMLCEECGVVNMYDYTIGGLVDTSQYENNPVLANQIGQDYTASILRNNVEMLETVREIEEENFEEELVAPVEPQPLRSIIRNTDGSVTINAQQYAIVSSKEDEEKIVPKDIEHHLDGDFNQYLVVHGSLDKGSAIITGSKKDLNAFICENNFTTAPKIYSLKQLKIETSYVVK